MTHAEHIAQLKGTLINAAVQLLRAENCTGIGYSIPDTEPEQLVLIGEVSSLQRFLEIRADEDAL